MYRAPSRDDPAAYRWAILALGTIAQTGYSAVLLGVAVLAPPLGDEYGLSVSQIGVLLGCVSAGALVSQLPWGAAVDRFGERGPAVAGLLGSAAALGVAARDPGYAGLAVCLGVAGAAGAVVNAASGSAIVSWFEPGQRGLALGVRQAGVPLGGTLAALVLPVMTDTAGVDGALLALAAGCVGAAVAGSAGFRSSPRAASPVRGCIPCRTGACCGCAPPAACSTGARRASCASRWLFLTDYRSMRLGTAAGVLAGVQAAAICSRIGAGRWSDHVGRRIGPFRTIAFATGGATILLGLLTDAGLGVVVAAVTVAGFLATSWNGLSYAAVSELADDGSVGTAIGLQQTAHAAVQAVSPIPFALIVDHISWGAAYAAAGITAVAAGALLVSLVAAEGATRGPRPEAAQWSGSP